MPKKIRPDHLSRNVLIAALGVMVIIMTAAPQSAFAATPTSGAAVCVKGNGLVYVIGKGFKKKKCAKKETLISFEVGAKSLKGLPGFIGPQGPQGLQGLAGKDGANGQHGVNGAVGPKGDQGERGLQGLTGLTGEIGLVGPQGEIGPKGDTGPQGPEGGPVGPAGPQGEQGDKGAQGEKGDKGDQGEQGADGEDGQDGEDASFDTSGYRTETVCVKPNGQVDKFLNAFGGPIDCADGDTEVDIVIES